MRKLGFPTLAVFVIFVALSNIALVPRLSDSSTATPLIQVLPSATLAAGRSVPLTLALPKIRLKGTARAIATRTALATHSRASATSQPTIAITATPTKVKPTPVLPLSQAGNTDRIVVIGTLIVAIIIIPMVLKRKEWRMK